LSKKRALRPVIAAMRCVTVPGRRDALEATPRHENDEPGAVTREEAAATAFASGNQTVTRVPP
jgi:hypothetical protein